MFHRLPAEILSVIASSTCADLQTSLALCQLNKYCNSSCTYSLYGHPIKLSTDKGMRSFCGTLLKDNPADGRPNPSMAVRSISMRGDGTLPDNVKNGEKSILMLDHIRLALKTCTNLHTLSLVSPRDRDEAISDAFTVLFKGCTITASQDSDGLAFPHLRHLELQFTFNISVFNFVEAHRRDLQSLALYHEAGSVTNELSILEEIFSDEPGTESDDESEGQTSFETSSYSPAYTSLSCSPILVLHLIPGSHVENVNLSWWNAEDIDVDTLALDLVQSLQKSKATHGIRTLSYASNSWNSNFMNKAPEYLPRLELLGLLGYLYYSQDNLGGGQDFIGPIFRATHSLLPSFKNLKVLILRADECPGGTDRAYYEDFKTAAEWAKLCPSLLYVVLPFSRSSWIRDSEYDFFVPDTFIQQYTRATAFSSTQPEGYHTNPNTRYPPEYTAEFIHKLIKREGMLMATQYFAHFERLREKTCGVVQQVEELLDNAGLLKETRRGTKDQLNRLVYGEYDADED